jgi:hypothetical protein
VDGEGDGAYFVVEAGFDVGLAFVEGRAGGFVVVIECLGVGAYPGGGGAAGARGVEAQFAEALAEGAQYADILIT